MMSRSKKTFILRDKLLLAFVFGLIAVLSFLTFKNMPFSTAVNSAYNGFKAGDIISDYIMQDYTSMSEAEIQNFLKSKNPCNRAASNLIPIGNNNLYGSTVNYKMYYNGDTYYYHVENGKYVCMADERFNGESAAHIIWQAAHDYRINPKVIIVLLQKEQGLVTDTWPNANYQYRSATGYGCPDTAACSSQYYGFKNQIRNAAELFRYILDNGSRYYPVGNNSIKFSPDGSCGNSTVYIENRATAALYQYTPYQPNGAVLGASPGTTVNCGAYGNANFYYYYTTWFGDTHVTLNSIYVSSSDKYTLKTSGNKYLSPTSNNTGATIALSSSAAEYKFERSGDFYIIRHVASNKVLDTVNYESNNGARLQLNDARNTCSQRWLLQLNDSNNYTLRTACSWRAVDVPSAQVSKDGVEVQLYDNNQTNAQKFILTNTSAAPVSNGTYIITTPSEKTMDIADGRTANGTRIHTFDYTYGNNQQFTITRGTDGFYTIKNIASNRVLDVAGASSSNGAAVQLYSSNNTCAQKWTIEKSGTGYRFLSACSNKAIDVPGGHIGRPFQTLQIYTANNTNAQVWLFHTLKPISDGNYTINSALGKNIVMDVNGGAEKSKNGTNIQIWEQNNTNAQKFQLAYNANARAYTIKNYTANRVLDVSGAGKTDGTNTQVWQANNTCAQYWHIHKRTDGFYNIFSACSEKVLDVSGAGTKNGTNIQIWGYNNTNAQKWSFEKI